MKPDRSIHERLRDRLIDGQFQPGQKLRAEVLKDDYGCSASAIRENLFRLSTEGIVEFQEQRGFRVPQNSRTLKHELTQMRIMLESEGACLSIRNGGLAWEARLTAAHHKLSHIESRVTKKQTDEEMFQLWAAAELEFHQTLIDACGSELLKATHRLVYNRFRQQLIASDRLFDHVPQNAQQHLAILSAALDRDEALVRQRIAEHLGRHLKTPKEMA